MKRNIILTGFMGCGKSTIGRLTSSLTGFEYIDMDMLIQRQHSMSVSEIFEVYGENYFRKAERGICKLCSLISSYIIATGGGVIKDEDNMHNLSRNGVIVYLSSSPGKIYSNLKHDNSRPLLSGGNKLEKITQMLNERTPLYEKYAEICIDVSNTFPENAAKLLLHEVMQISSIRASLEVNNENLHN